MSMLPNYCQEAATVNSHLDSLLSLTPYGLFIVLWTLDNPPKKDIFHWGLYFHTSPQKGRKYHIVNNVPNNEYIWIPDHGETSGVFKFKNLCVLIQIADLSLEKVNVVDKVIRSMDTELYQYPGITCRLWVMSIVDILSQLGLIKCPNLDDLEAECKTIGNNHHIDVIQMNQPRSVVRSQVCLGD